MKRRDFLTLAAAGASSTLVVPSLSLSAVAAPRQTQITAGKTRLNIAGAGQPDTDLWLYNQSCPGPMLRYRKGDTLRAAVRNNLDVPTTIHWHGIRNLSEMDGVPDLSQAPIEPGETFEYEFPLKDSGTYWYHAHNMGWEQVARGLYGPLIIDDDGDPPVDHDICLMIDDWRLDNDGQIHQASLGSLHDWSHAGRLGNWLTVNGLSAPSFQVKDKARIRLRMINAANARVMTIQLDDAEATLVALDGAVCLPEQINRIILAPAQRADVILDMDRGILTLSEVSTGEPYPAGTINVDPALGVSSLGTSERAKTALTLPAPPKLPSLNNVRRIPIHMQGGAMGNLQSALFDGEEKPLRELAQNHKKLWAFNGAVGDYRQIMAEIELNSLVSIDVYNDTAWQHAMHLHGHHFWVLSDDPTIALPSGQRDTWLMQPQERISLVFRADNPGLWLFHCHMLEHAAAGMGAVLSIS